MLRLKFNGNPGDKILFTLSGYKIRARFFLLFETSFCRRETFNQTGILCMHIASKVIIIITIIN